MIFIDRKKGTVPQILIDESSEEHRKAEKHYNSKKFKKNPKKNGFKGFKLYSHPTVKEALEELFNEKCAYCEMQITVGHDSEKEHFRPKAMVKDSTIELRPGYYWLSADWDNLLLSCSHCNKARIQHTQDGIQKTIGKANQFPLLDNRKRQTKSTEPSDDLDRLLINPCIENPEDYFEFDSKGSILPKKGLIGKKRKMAEVSLEVYALIRLKLVKKREAHIITVLELITDIQKRLRDFIKYETDEFKDDLIIKLEKLEKIQIADNPHNEYMAVTRQLIKEHKTILLKALDTIK